MGPGDAAVPPQRAGCDPRPGIAELIARDPHNAYPWTLALADAQARHDPIGAAEALANAASADVFDDYLWKIEHRVLSALASLPPLPVERDPAAIAALAPDGGFDPDGGRMMLGLGVLMAVSVPSYGSLSEACRPPTDRSADPTAAAQCRQIALRMMDPAGTQITWFVGHAIAQRWASDPADQAALETEMRRMRYLAETSGMMTATLDRNPAELRAYGQRRRDSESEIRFAEAELVRAGLPIDPPADWRSMVESPAAP
jgi:hypothetical protein